MAAASVVARIRDLLHGADPNVADEIALKLTNLGEPNGDTHVPAKGKIPATPQIVDRETAWEYLDALYKHLREGKPNGGFDVRRNVL